ncbi:DUF91 domain-containing protein [Pseudomonas sp. BN414]|uniref:endonuclease NucS domain-containing protein n=1 Tax=Pseudomonas sp. BN414 TaxID=2567888 RepID=UPI002457DC93|nr:endonuclease NucS domain-containing protein [Pseudomonas sp. BN414]MDH4565940.1 DUF91 domain-containing protein [Pseudomonas sp. BN414]
MHERALEILVRSCLEDIFGAGWNLLAQQLSLPSGRLDLLIADGAGNRHLIELKKGRAKPDAITQAIRYSEELSALLDGAAVMPWVVAHEIPNQVAEQAENSGVKTLAISYSKCEALMLARGLGEKDLIGERRAAGVLHGGTGKSGLWEAIDNEGAFSEMPHATASLLRGLERTMHFIVQSGRMQTAVYYRGVKLGGVNRKHRHCYISSGVVVRSDFTEFLSRHGFRRKCKTQASSSHEHIWWDVPLQNSIEFGLALQQAKLVVDRSLRLI